MVHVGPVACELGARRCRRTIPGDARGVGIAQKGKRVVQVAIEKGMVLDHRRNAGVAVHGSAQHAQANALVRARLEQAQHDGRIEEGVSRFERQRAAAREFGARAGTAGQLLEDTQAHAAEKDLGIDEARAEIEECAGPAARDGPGEPERSRCALEPGIGEQPITQRQPAIAKGQHVRGVLQGTSPGCRVAR